MSIPIREVRKVAFTTEYPPSTIARKGHVDVSSSTQYPEVIHNLGYIPFVKVMYEYPIGSGRLRTASYSTGSPVQVLVRPTEDMVILNAFNNLGPGNPSFSSPCRLYYRIYRRPS